jgi:hypothetical protein
VPGPRQVRASEQHCVDEDGPIGPERTYGPRAGIGLHRSRIERTQRSHDNIDRRLRPYSNHASSAGCLPLPVDSGNSPPAATSAPAAFTKISVPPHVNG